MWVTLFIDNSDGLEIQFNINIMAILLVRRVTTDF